MKILLHTSSLARPILRGELALERLPDLAAQAGFAGLEWLDRLMPQPQAQAWQALAQAQTAAGLDQAALSISLEPKTRPALLAAQIERALAMLELGLGLGVERVRVALGGGRASLDGLLQALPGSRARAGGLGRTSRQVYAWLAGSRLGLGLSAFKHRRLPPRARPEALAQAAQALEPLLWRATELGLRLGLENHFGLTSHPEDMLAIMEQTNGRLGVCLDLGNFYSKQDWQRAIGLLAGRTVLVHFKTTQIDAAAEGRRLDYARRLDLLRAAGFKGTFSAEYIGPGDGLAGARAGAELLQRLWPRAGDI